MIMNEEKNYSLTDVRAGGLHAIALFLFVFADLSDAPDEAKDACVKLLNAIPETSAEEIMDGREELLRSLRDFTKTE